MVYTENNGKHDKQNQCKISKQQSKSKQYHNSKKLVTDKMKDKSGEVAIEGFVGLKPKMYSYLVDNNVKSRQ